MFLLDELVAQEFGQSLRYLVFVWSAVDPVLQMPNTYMFLSGKLQLVVDGISSHAQALVVSVIDCYDPETRAEGAVSHEIVKRRTTWAIHVGITLITVANSSISRRDNREAFSAVLMRQTPWKHSGEVRSGNSIVTEPFLAFTVVIRT
jgi:hypothetical protein